MKPFIFLLLLLVSLAANPDALKVTVSVLPQKTFVEHIGGEQVTVKVMVEAGYSPATYQPTSRQIMALSDADLYVRAGMPFEEIWMERILTINPDLQVLDMRDGIELLPMNHAHQERHPEGDPHIWTDPLRIKQHGLQLAQELGRMLPEHRETFKANYQQFALKLDKLNEEIRDLLRHKTGRSFMVFHPAWSYFAQRYDLTQLAVEYQGKEPAPKTLAALISTAKEENVRKIFVQPQFSRRLADSLANKLGLSLHVADPLAKNYFESMRLFALKLAEEEG